MVQQHGLDVKCLTFRSPGSCKTRSIKALLHDLLQLYRREAWITSRKTLHKDRVEMHSISEQLDKGVSISILIIILYWICNCAADNKERCLIHICICWEDCSTIIIFTKYLFFIHLFLWKQRVHKWIPGLWLIGQEPELWGKSLTLEITVLGKLVSFISAFM